MNKITKHGIDYSVPSVQLLHASPLWVAEVAGRTAYDSFESSEHVGVKLFPVDHGKYFQHNPDIESSALLTSLAWVHHHHSVIELVDISFSIKGTSRGVLQEHARHRMQSLTVQSTRYTMSGVLNAYIATWLLWDDISLPTAYTSFVKKLMKLDVFIFQTEKMVELEAMSIYDKLSAHVKTGEVSIYDMLSAEGGVVYETALDRECIFDLLQRCKKKRNVGDIFKYIVTDNWKVDMVIKFNLRSLKNYLGLRASGAAYWQIDMLAKEMIKATPAKYIDLIIKKK